MTITQTVDIPANRRLTINIPREVPVGVKAHFELKVIPCSSRVSGDVNRTAPRSGDAIPFIKKNENPSEAGLLKFKFSKKELEELLQDAHTPISDSLSGILANLGNITSEQIREERLAEYFT